MGTASITTVGRETDKFDYLGSARARLGFLVAPNVLAYGTGGLAWTRFVQTLDASSLVTDPVFGTISIASTTSTPSWRFGFAVGGGVEARLWDSNWLARVEYLHYDFGDSGGSSSSSPGFSNSFTSDRLTADVVRGGLSYKFGEDQIVAAAYPGMPVKAMPVKAPRAAPIPWNWSGFYLGAHAGYGWGRDPFSDPRDTGLVLNGINSNGFVGGFQAGGNWQRGAWVGGLEIDLSGTGIKGSTSGSVTSTIFGPTTHTVTRSDKFELLGSARSRVGYLVWPNLLVYGTGGLAWMRLVQTTDDTVSGASPSASTTTTPSWRFGWVAGLGGETRLWDTNWLARVEYLHYDFDESSSNFSTGSPSTTSGHLTVDVVRAGVSYKLGQFAPDAPVQTAMLVKAPRAAAAPWSWSGYYLGGHAGYGWGRDPISDAFFGGKQVPFSDVNSRGFVAGFQAGANWQMASWVSGLEIDLSATGIKGSTTGVGTGLFGPASETLTDRFKLLGSARARLGSLFLSPNVLLYGTGGLAWTRLVQDDVDVFGHFGSSTPFWKFGWVGGVGGEARLWDSNWLVRLEYLHYDFGDAGSNSSFASIAPPATPATTSSSSHSTGHLTADVVRTGLSFKFD